MSLPTANADQYSNKIGYDQEHTPEAQQQLVAGLTPIQTMYAQTTVAQFGLDNIQTNQFYSAIRLLLENSEMPNLFEDMMIFRYLTSLISGDPYGDQILQVNSEVGANIQTAIVQARAATIINAKLSDSANVHFEMATNKLWEVGATKVNAGIRIKNKSDDSIAYLTYYNLTADQLKTIVNDTDRLSSILRKTHGKGQAIELVKINRDDSVVERIKHARLKASLVAQLL